MDYAKTAQAINTLGSFCGKRDLAALTSEALQKASGLTRADVLILFGGSIPCAIDRFAEAMRLGLAVTYMIVGGEGHTTESLRQKIAAVCPQIRTKGKMEAEVFSEYLSRRYGLMPDLVETASTNCGNNVTNSLALLRENGISFRSLIIMQDATMQLRMDAGFRKYLSEERFSLKEEKTSHTAHQAGEIQLLNYACYRTDVVAKDGALSFVRPEWGMWDMERYITLLMGEIPRLRDDPNGYGPKGKGFIAHVDIPDEVEKAYEYLKENLGDHSRKANPAYATKAPAPPACG